MSKKKVATGAERVASHRARKADAGSRRIDATISKAAAANLDAYVAQGMTVGKVLSDLLEKNPPRG